MDIERATYKKSRPAITPIMIFRLVPRRPKYGFMMAGIVDRLQVVEGGQIVYSQALKAKVDYSLG